MYPKRVASTGAAGCDEARTDSEDHQAGATIGDVAARRRFEELLYARRLQPTIQQAEPDRSVLTNAFIIG